MFTWNRTLWAGSGKTIFSKYSFFVGNKAALEKSVRFIDADLNRCFPGNINGNHEERIAYDLLNKAEGFDFIVDLHSSSNACPLFGLITKPDSRKIEFARNLGLSKLVIMPDSFANGKALIDFAKYGISLEIGPHHKKENIDEAAGHIRHFLEKKPANIAMEIFEVFSVIKKQGTQTAIKNFEDIKKALLLQQGSVLNLISRQSWWMKNLMMESFAWLAEKGMIVE